MQVDIPTTHEGAVDIKGQVAQLKEKIKSVEAQKGPISYSVGKDNNELIVLREPVQQQAEIQWNQDKTRQVIRDRFIVIGSFGIGAVDFDKQALFDSSDNIPESRSSLGEVTSPGIEYPQEGKWEYIPGADEDNGRSEKGFIRNILQLNGGDKHHLNRPVNIGDQQFNLQNPETVAHNSDGLVLTSEGLPAIKIGYDFSAPISEAVTVEEFSQALQSSIESIKPVELKTNTSAQNQLLEAALNSF